MGDGEPTEGLFEGKYYVDGKPTEGFSDGKYYDVDGEPFNGHYDVDGKRTEGFWEQGKYYVNGEPVNGEFGGKHCTDGEFTNGESGGKHYTDGELTNGESGGKHYTDGGLTNGESGFKYYVDGKRQLGLFNGKYYMELFDGEPVKQEEPGGKFYAAGNFIDRYYDMDSAAQNAHMEILRLLLDPNEGNEDLSHAAIVDTFIDRHMVDGYLNPTLSRTERRRLPTMERLLREIALS